MAERPFGQRRYIRRRIKLDLPLRGPAYKFLLLLPVVDSNGRTIFSPREEALLSVLLSGDFGDYTVFGRAANPLLSGGYVNTRHRLIVDRNMLFEVYARQTEEAVRYFEELGKHLTEYSRTEIAKRLATYQGEEQIFVEYTSVTIADTYV